MRLTPEAEQDLAEQYAYIAGDNRDAADRYLEAAYDGFRKLDRMPRMGHRFESREPELAGLRSWPIQGFEYHTVFYRCLDSEIEVVRVLHGARDVLAILEKKK